MSIPSIITGNVSCIIDTLSVFLHEVFLFISVTLYVVSFLTHIESKFPKLTPSQILVKLVSGFTRMRMLSFKHIVESVVILTAGSVSIPTWIESLLKQVFVSLIIKVLVLVALTIRVSYPLTKGLPFQLYSKFESVR